ncbi:MAG: putative ABC transporter permease [Fusicatenibacter sp.]|nr:putative ABC transporter permease [Fusicatenibacter sp.]
MWNIQILGVDLYHVLSWFWLYSFCGWIWESSYVSIKQKKLVNRGFVNGPLLTIYGTGAVTVYLILRPVEDKWYFLYFGGMMVATVLEYVTGVLMEKIFHAHWWDYSDQKFNFQGKICLGSSIAWGFFALILFYVLQPIAEKVVDLVDRSYGEIIVSVITICYLIDFGFSAAAAFQLGQKMRSVEKSWSEFIEYLQSSKFTQLADELSARMLSYHREYSPEKIREYIKEKKLLLEEAMEQLRRLDEEKKERSRYFAKITEHKERFETLGTETLELLSSKTEEFRKDFLEHFELFEKLPAPQNKIMDLITKRYLRAYPHLDHIRVPKIKQKKKEKETYDSKSPDKNE